jgi:radical SAM protein
MKDPHPLELHTQESENLLDSIAAFGEPLPHVVFTGGDPMMRQDLLELIGYGAALGLEITVTPAATEMLSKHSMAQLKEAGAQSVAFSLDGSVASRHDPLRQVSGCFKRTIQAAKWANEVGLDLEINTLVSEETLNDLEAIHEFLYAFQVSSWNLYFLIPVGRGKQLRELDPQTAEELMAWIIEKAQRSSFEITTCEAPSHRRIVHQRMVELSMRPVEARGPSARRSFGLRDGNGTVFVSHLGTVYPSGFLPISAGNVRIGDLVDIYRESNVFRNIREVDRFKGKCGRCEFRRICGGSRARAYAHCGDPTGSDPLCPFEPIGAHSLPGNKPHPSWVQNMGPSGSKRKGENNVLEKRPANDYRTHHG